MGPGRSVLLGIPRALKPGRAGRVGGGPPAPVGTSDDAYSRLRPMKGGRRWALRGLQPFATTSLCALSAMPAALALQDRDRARGSKVNANRRPLAPNRAVGARSRANERGWRPRASSRRPEA